MKLTKISIYKNLLYVYNKFRVIKQKKKKERRNQMMTTASSIAIYVSNLIENKEGRNTFINYIKSRL